MPKNELSTDDPLELVGCVIDGDASGSENMARCFIEEFYLMGWHGQRILELFRNPFYLGPHNVYKAFGEDWVKSLINDVALTLSRRREQKSSL